MKLYRIYAFIAILSLRATFLPAQEITFPQKLEIGHPRLLTDGKTGKQRLQNLLNTNTNAQKTYQEVVKNIEPYVIRHQTDTTWITSRLQMYWKSHATDVYIKGGIYAHADGHAPVPTVRFTGTRDAVTSYGAPKLEDILPYMEDARGLYYVNRSLPGNPMEWVDQSKTGRVVESINRQIMGMAQTAAFVFWYSGDEKYAKFACDLFDTYMMGIYYRNEPKDLNHSHNQTLVGFSSFEVIHEDILNELTSCYDFLYEYLNKYQLSKINLYADAFKKWANLIIKNGVPFNNWNLIEARFTASIAFILEDNDKYADGKGCQYYIDQIFNKNHSRQWSIPKLMSYGLNPNTGIWCESPGYSQNVIGDFASFVTLFDNTLKFDLLPQLPLISKAVSATTQYMYPNGNIVGFGDTHYGILSSNAMQQMIVNAQHFHKQDQEVWFTRMMKMVQAFNDQGHEKNTESGYGNGFTSLFTRSDFVMNDTIKPGQYADFATATFYASNVSWFVQRNGFTADHGLMISEAGSLGNHMHSNGIAMELYGKGLVLAPEGGIGTSYFQPDYAEYYSQFPAHNTVVVDGISKYPEMKSNHAFELLSCYPASGQKNGYFPFITYSEVHFLEPETNADQYRLMSIIRTSDSTGYYVDIFRSKRKNGKDKYHDYFYHNLGQELVIKDAEGKPADMKPTEKLSFANGDLYAYDYLWDKKSIVFMKDFTATYTLKILGKSDIFMNVWLKGDDNRELFTVKSPASKAWGNTMIPKDIADLPLNTLVVRQSGQAWTRPFVSIYEPSTGNEPGDVGAVSYFGPDNADSTFVGIKIKTKRKCTQYILSSESNKKLQIDKKLFFEGSFGVITENEAGLQYLFLGNGISIDQSGYGLTTNDQTTSASLLLCGEHLFFTSQAPVTLTIPDSFKKGKVILTYNDGSAQKSIEGKRVKRNNQVTISFQMPAMPYQRIEIEN